MSKDFFLIDGRYFFLDDETGEILEATISKDTVNEVDKRKVIKAFAEKYKYREEKNN